jgi:hypothetical protein
VLQQENNKPIAAADYDHRQQALLATDLQIDKYKEELLEFFKIEVL